MPFLDDTGPRDERRGPIWAAFATISSQVERMVAANVGWALQLVPGLLALPFSELPGWLRIVFALYSATALPPATAVLFGIAAEACRGQHVDLGLAGELLREYAGRSVRTLAPLYGTFGVLLWAAVLSDARDLGPVVAVLTLLTLLWSVCATYWGPLFVAKPELSPVALARESVRLTRRRPEGTLATWAVVGVSWIVGAVSIGGLVLIVPMFVATLQTHRYRESAGLTPRGSG
jgi:hypothetical protein